jgi:CRP-like cAMP-binding protein
MITQLSAVPVTPIINLRKNKCLYRQNDSAHSAYILKVGRVLLIRDDPVGRSFGCGIVSVGETFGEELLDGTKRRHIAMALESTSVGILNVDSVSTRQLRHDAFQRLIFLEELWATHEGIERVKKIMARYGPRSRDFTFVTIAMLAGLSREQVSRFASSDIR